MSNKLPNNQRKWKKSRPYMRVCSHDFRVAGSILTEKNAKNPPERGACDGLHQDFKPQYLLLLCSDSDEIWRSVSSSWVLPKVQIASRAGRECTARKA